MMLINIEPEVLCYRTTGLQVFIPDFGIRPSPRLSPTHSQLASGYTLRNWDVHRPQYIIDIDVQLNIVHLAVLTGLFIYCLLLLLGRWVVFH